MIRVIASACKGRNQNEDALMTAELIQTLAYHGYAVRLCNGVFEGKREVSVEITSDHFTLHKAAALAYRLAIQFRQNCVYVTDGQDGYLVDGHKGELVKVGTQITGSAKAIRELARFNGHYLPYTEFMDGTALFSKAPLRAMQPITATEVLRQRGFGLAA